MGTWLCHPGRQGSFSERGCRTMRLLRLPVSSMLDEHDILTKPYRALWCGGLSLHLTFHLEGLWDHKTCQAALQVQAEHTCLRLKCIHQQTCTVMSSANLLLPWLCQPQPDVSCCTTNPSAHTILYYRWPQVSRIHKKVASVCINTNVLLQSIPLQPLMINQKEKLQACVTELLSLPMPNANQMFSIHQRVPPPPPYLLSQSLG